MKLDPVSDSLFRSYGQILSDYDFDELLGALSETPLPADGFVYEASDPKLERLAVFEELQNRAYGGLPMQLGYCNGVNSKLNCLEYHRNSELLIAEFDTVLLLGLQKDISVDGLYDTANVHAFLLPAGMGVELFATTLHYAPCNAMGERGFRVANGLPRGTNGARPASVGATGEDALLRACNKWLLAHEESDEAKQGAAVRLRGENIDIRAFEW